MATDLASSPVTQVASAVATGEQPVDAVDAVAATRGIDLGSISSPDDLDIIVRTLAAQYLDGFGRGHDWWRTSCQAAFVLSCLYQESSAPPSDCSPISRWLPALEITLPPISEEGFTIGLRQVVLSGLPPVPSPNGTGASTIIPPPRSTLAVSAARLVPTTSLLDAAPGTLGRCLLQPLLAASFSGHALVRASGAILTLWQASRSTGVVAGATTFRNLENRASEAAPPGSIRMDWRRTGQAATAAFSESRDGGVVLAI